ncbi:hypothetical protein XELAEV_18026495mg, partial [Xenopus laevis]
QGNLPRHSINLSRIPPTSLELHQLAHTFISPEFHQIIQSSTKWSRKSTSLSRVQPTCPHFHQLVQNSTNSSTVPSIFPDFYQLRQALSLLFLNRKQWWNYRQFGETLDKQVEVWESWWNCFHQRPPACPEFHQVVQSSTKLSTVPPNFPHFHQLPRVPPTYPEFHHCFLLENKIQFPRSLCECLSYSQLNISMSFS